MNVDKLEKILNRLTNIKVKIYITSDDAINCVYFVSADDIINNINEKYINAEINIRKTLKMMFMNDKHVFINNVIEIGIETKKLLSEAIVDLNHFIFTSPESSFKLEEALKEGEGFDVDHLEMDDYNELIVETVLGDPNDRLYKHIKLVEDRTKISLLNMIYDFNAHYVYPFTLY